MRRAMFAALLMSFCVSLLEAQSTIYWSKDHVYAGADGKEIAIVTPPTSDTTAPTTPSGLASSSLTATSVYLSWTGSTDSGGSGLAGYKVYRQMGSGASLPVGTVTAASFTDQPLQPSTSYTYVIRALDNAQNHSAASGSVSITTLSSSTDTIAPSVPVNVQGNPVSTTSIALTWAASADAGGSGVAGYKVYRGGTLVSGGSLLSSPAFSDTGLTANTSYSYTVTATDGVGHVSAASAPTSVSTNQTVIFSDDFNRSDTYLSSPWFFYPSSAANVVSRAVVLSRQSSAYTWINALAATAPTIFKASVDILSTAQCCYDSKGIYFWGSAYGPRYRVVLSGSTIFLAFFSDGYTDYDYAYGEYTLATASGVSTPSTLTVQADSSSRIIKVYQNGTLKITFTETDMTRPNSGYLGITGYFTPSSTANFVVDNFQVVVP